MVFFIYSASRALFAISLEKSDRRYASKSRYSASEVIGLLNSENLNDFATDPCVHIYYCTEQTNSA